jgi:HlyD family secretion protein
MRAVPLLPALAALALGCTSSQAHDKNARTYRVGAADRGDVRVLVEETGVVEPERQIVVKSPISGVVQLLYVREGDRVATGAPLARIVPDIAQANVFAQLRSGLAQAELQRAVAEREYRRAESLAQSNGVTQSELDQKRLIFEQAGSQLRTAREQLTLVQQSGVTTGDTAQWARVTAPVAGVVIRRGVEAGETVVGGTSAFGGGTELFTIADLSSLRVKAAINEVDIGKVQAGDSVALTVDAYPSDTVLGIVRLVPPAARLQDRVRVFDVEIAVRGRNTVLKPGMTANVRIVGPSRHDVIRVPVEGVFLSEGQPTVFKLVGGTPRRLPVRLGLSDLSYAEVLSGLAPGDSIALEDPAVAAEHASNPARRR